MAMEEISVIHMVVIVFGNCFRPVVFSVQMELTTKGTVLFLRTSM